MNTTICKMNNEKEIEQFLFHQLIDTYLIIEDTMFIYNENKEIIAVFLKKFFSKEEYTTMRDYVLNLDNDTNQYKMELNVDPMLVEISEKVNKINRNYNDKLCDKFSILNIFDNYSVDIHRDSEERMMKNLFVVKHEEVNGLTVFPEYNIAFMIQPRDLLLFDTQLLHYVSTDRMVSKKRYRYAMYFE